MEKTKEFRDTDKRLIILLLIFTFEIFVLLFLILPLTTFKVLTESFNKIAIGFSALTAVIFGPTIVVKEIEKDRKIKEYLKRFPHDKFSTDWEIIESDKYPGAIYVLDKKNKIKHHILNMKTVYNLGWHIYSRKTLKNSEFLSFKIGDRIRTQGEAGE